MIYYSIGDLARSITEKRYKIPLDVDLIVGVPRSGTLAASVLALKLNVETCGLADYIEDRPLQGGARRQHLRSRIERPSEARHALILDDSLATGTAMSDVRRKLAAMSWSGKRTFAVVYISEGREYEVDVWLERTGPVRAYEWNLFHGTLARFFCVDIDGVLCEDPSPEVNDDGPAYRRFLTQAKPMEIPTAPIGHLVTSRLEKFRPETEAWLAASGIRFDHLHMLDLPDIETRRRLNPQARYKSDVYSSLPDTLLFVESEDHIAEAIAHWSGKHALCTTTQTFYVPGAEAIVRRKARTLASRLRNRLACVGRGVRIGRKPIPTQPDPGCANLEN